MVSELSRLLADSAWLLPKLKKFSRSDSRCQPAIPNRAQHRNESADHPKLCDPPSAINRHSQDDERLAVWLLPSADLDSRPETYLIISCH